MPIYMDRHDVSDAVTADHVAQLHQQDLKIQHQYGCRGLTYWFDDKRNTAFCLIEAPDMSAIRSMHDHAHGQIPNRIIEVSPELVESFLGRIEDPEKSGSDTLNIIDEPAFRIIMMIAVRRSSPDSKDTEDQRSRLEELNRNVQKIIGSTGGKLVRQGDHRLVVSFRSVSRAVDAAFEIRTEFEKTKPALAATTLKISLSAGEPVTDKSGIFENSIRLAERMCKIVKGEIILGSEVKELYGNEKPSGLPNPKKTHCLTPMDERFLTSLMDFTESAWQNFDFKVDDFGKPIGCSKSQLYRKMISLTGKSPSSFIKEYRLNEALMLLRKHARNISEIAFETGFNSPSYFSKCFQKQFGRLPSDYLAAVEE